METNDVDDEMPPLEDYSDRELPMEGRLLVSRHALSAQVKEDERELDCKGRIFFILTVWWMENCVA